MGAVMTRPEYARQCRNAALASCEEQIRAARAARAAGEMSFADVAATAARVLAEAADEIDRAERFAAADPAAPAGEPPVEPPAPDPVDLEREAPHDIADCSLCCGTTEVPALVEGSMTMVRCWQCEGTGVQPGFHHGYGQ